MIRRFQNVHGLAVALLLAILAVVQLPGCSGGGGGGGAGAAGFGTFQVGLTDKQSDAFQQVVVTIKEVRVVPTSRENAADNDPALPVVATFNPPRTIDVLSLHFQQEILGTVNILGGTYSQVRLILEPNPVGQGSNPVNYLVLKADPTTRIPLTTPSGQQSGLKVLGPFVVAPGRFNTILIDFDPNTAIVPGGDGAYKLKPAGIRFVQPKVPLTSFGILSGTITATFKDFSSAGVTVAPPGGLTISNSGGLSGGVVRGILFSSFSSNRWEGPFTMFVPGGSYRVYVQAEGFAPYSSPVQTVTVGVDTPVGNVPLVTPPKPFAN